MYWEFHRFTQIYTIYVYTFVIILKKFLGGLWQKVKKKGFIYLDVRPEVSRSRQIYM